MNPLSLPRAIEFYLDHRRQLGFALKEDGWMLRGLARYAAKRGHRGPLRNSLVLAWAQAPAQAQRIWWARRLDAARRFAAFWRTFDPRTELPPRGVFGPSYRRRPVHIYTAHQITLLMEAAGKLGGVRGAAFESLLGLLACTGMRIGEALRLQERDIDWARALLTIHGSKSGRSRCLPLHESTLTALRSYQRKRLRTFTIKDRSTFFLGRNGRKIGYGQAAYTFRCLCRQLGWTESPVPRIHDLRHTFAVACLIDWHRQRHDVDQKVLGLATYLGHRNIANTYWYLSAVPELLALTHARWPELKTQVGGSHA